MHDGANRRMKSRRMVRALAVMALPIMVWAASAVHAQNVIRSPQINIPSRAVVVTPHIAPNAAARVNPNLPHINPVIRSPQPSLVGRLVTHPQLPYLHVSPNLYPSCDDGCDDVSVTAVGNDSPSRRHASVNRRHDAAQPAVDLRIIADEIVAEIDGSLTEAQADEIARRHGLRRVQSQNFPLIGATIGLFRITDRRSVDIVSRELSAEASIRSVQPNYRYLLQQQKSALKEGDPSQYALAKLRLPEAHTLAHGTNVRVAVIDSGIDSHHPELANSIVDSFDALGSSEGPHVHGTGIAGAIAAHARLMGGAPKAGLIAIRAFGATQSNSYVILKALDYAAGRDAGHNAEIINMSFAGPKDPLIERGVDAVAAKGIIMVAAAGNAGIKSPPLYPAANPNVIAVSATDADDHLFNASNRGAYITVAAPGVDIFLPAPDGKYQITSGTSFSAAYVTALAALMIERNPALRPEELRAMLTKTARDIGSPGRDDQFGAGEADAFAAVKAVIAMPPAPIALSSAPPSAAAGENAPEQRQNPPIQAATPPASAIAADKPARSEADPSGNQ
jgi:hypothetical protein